MLHDVIPVFLCATNQSVCYMNNLFPITYMDSKSEHRLLATYSSSTVFRFCPLHSVIIFSSSSIDCSNAAIRASLGKKNSKELFRKIVFLLARSMVSGFQGLLPVTCFPALITTGYCFPAFTTV